jgi:hypothetical protein
MDNAELLEHTAKLMGYSIRVTQLRELNFKFTHTYEILAPNGQRLTQSYYPILSLFCPSVLAHMADTYDVTITVEAYTLAEYRMNIEMSSDSRC